MFEYNICSQADEDIFYKQCAALERNIPNLERGDLLEDVGGSLLQCYKLNGSDVIVYNDCYVNDVHIKSGIDLLQFFSKETKTA